jgi:predicted anti-sigma-YlaC factor YlaD
MKEPASPESAELDPHLLALFRTSEPAPPSAPLVPDDFVERVRAHLRRRRRRRRIARIAAAAVTLVGLGFVMGRSLPRLEAAVRALPLAAADSVAPLGGWLLTPAGWSVSLLLAAGVLWRSKAFRR